MTLSQLLRVDPAWIAAPYWAIGLLSFPRAQRNDILERTLPEAGPAVRFAFQQMRMHRDDDLLCLAGRAVIDACAAPVDTPDATVRVFASLAAALPGWRHRLAQAPAIRPWPWPQRWQSPSRSDALIALADAWIAESFLPPTAE